jgi:methyl-accepting chemotaxis protein
MEFDVTFGQELCDRFAKELGDVCSFMGHGGVIVASSVRERIGTVHDFAGKIMAREMDEHLVTAEESQASGGAMREGLNMGIDIDGQRVITLGIAKPLPAVTPMARIIRFCVTSLLAARRMEHSLFAALEEANRPSRRTGKPVEKSGSTFEDLNSKAVRACIMVAFGFDADEEYSRF